VHSDWFADDKAIGNEFADGLAGVGVADLIDFVGVQPDLALAAADHGGCETLLSTKVHPTGRIEMSVVCYEGEGPLGIEEDRGSVRGIAEL